MEIKDPIELLRECLKYEHALDLLREKLGIELKSGWHYACLDRLADEIEAAYMKLPVDADGLPIHIGDTLLKSTGAPKASYGEVVGVSDDSVWFDAKDGWESNWSNLTRHVKPDAVAEELARFLSACGDDDPHYYDEQIAEFAERIRKAVDHEQG